MKQCRVAVIGLGRWGSAYAEILKQLPHAELVGISDLDKKILKNLGIDTTKSIPRQFKKAVENRKENEY